MSLKYEPASVTTTQRWQVTQKWQEGDTQEGQSQKDILDEEEALQVLLLLLHHYSQAQS